MEKKEERVKIEELYRLYGFSKVSNSEDNYLLFTFSNGYFYNAEIISFGQFQVF